ncbi:hypothetical protein HGRIS_001157 [Hohenbuehelia grisea]|uniref:Uncharacterized protein n=1 Tax=Hohenbuehelia grisea TaxID=104357 RepID=A0ABR3JPY7_9AGAR
MTYVWRTRRDSRFQGAPVTLVLTCWKLAVKDCKVWEAQLNDEVFKNDVEHRQNFTCEKYARAAYRFLSAGPAYAKEEAKTIHDVSSGSATLCTLTDARRGAGGGGEMKRTGIVTVRRTTGRRAACDAKLARLCLTEASFALARGVLLPARSSSKSRGRGRRCVHS